MLVSHMGVQKLDGAELLVALHAAGMPDRESGKATISQNAGTLAKALAIDLPLPAVKGPTQVVVRAELRVGHGKPYVNQWPIWLVPRPAEGFASYVRVHRSLSVELARELFPAAKPFDAAKRDAVVVASAFDDELVAFIESGGRVLMLPSGQKGSFPMADHWFLRGAPIVLDHPLTRRIGRDMLVDLQHFDLSSPVVPNVDYLEMIDPVLMLWDSHDLNTVKTHGLIFETRAGKGRILVSALRHAGATNAAGRYVLATLVDHLATGPAPRNALSDSAWNRLKQKLYDGNIDLTNK